MVLFQIQFCQSDGDRFAVHRLDDVGTMRIVLIIVRAASVLQGACRRTDCRVLAIGGVHIGRWMNIVNNLLVVAVSANGRCDIFHGEVAVVVAAPSPVKMEIVVCVITVTDEGVSTLFGISGVDDRSAAVDIRFQHGRPLFCGIALVAPTAPAAATATFMGDILCIFVIISQTSSGLGGFGSRTFRCIIHFNSDATMVDQLRHLVIGLGKIIGHHIVVVCLLGIIHRMIAIIGIIGVAALTSCGIAVIVNDHCHCQSHTSAGNTAAIARRRIRICRTEVVVVAALIPFCLDEGSDCCVIA